VGRSRRTVRKDFALEKPEDWRGPGPRPKRGIIYLPHEYEAGDQDDKRRTVCSLCHELWEHRIHAPSHAPRSVPPTG